MFIKGKFRIIILVAALLTVLVTLDQMILYKLQMHHQKCDMSVESSEKAPSSESITDHKNTMPFMKAISSSNVQHHNSTTSVESHISKAEATLNIDFSELMETVKNKNISVEYENDCRYHKFIVYLCDSSRSCGGLADRQRGIVSSFILAIVTSRVFVIKFDKPCSIENVLYPYLYNWSICRKFVNTISKSKTKVFNFMDGSSFYDNIQNFEFETKWPWQVIFLKINSNLINKLHRRTEVKEHHTWLLSRSMQSTFSLILHVLFLPAKNISNTLDLFNKKYVRGKSLVCSHIRTGGNPTIPADNIFKRKPNETVVFKFLRRFTNPTKYILYLASDSNFVRQKFNEMFDNSIRMNISVVHIDRLGSLNRFKKQACEGLKFAVIEQLILAKCDTLLLTPSGFGKIAAYLRGNSGHLYMLDDKSGQVMIANIDRL